MKLLILSFYYPPDLSAGSFRAKALVEALHALRPDDLRVEVITTMPNRYHSMVSEAPEREDHGWLTIRRIRLPDHQSGMADQTKAFAAFALRARRETAGGHWDAVLATSSRLMTAALGAHIARRSGAPLYLDIRDLFADTTSDLLARSPLRVLLPIFRVLERRTLRAAARVNLVSAGFLPLLRDVAPQHDYRLFTNGIDDEFLDMDFSRRTSASDVPLILYAGNIGEGQGLHNVLPQAARLLSGRARIRVLGDGGRRRQLDAALAAAGVSDIELLPPVPRTGLYDHYREADILFLHLNDHDAFRKVLPSKIFEYAATGKPILAGVAGYAAEFLRAEVPGAEVFDPCDADGMAAAFERLVTGRGAFDRSAFCSKYARKAIMARMAQDILELAEAHQAADLSP